MLPAVCWGFPKPHIWTGSVTISIHPNHGLYSSCCLPFRVHLLSKSCIHADNSLYVICNDFLYSIHILGEDFSLNFKDRGRNSCSEATDEDPCQTEIAVTTGEKLWVTTNIKIHFPFPCPLPKTENRRCPCTELFLKPILRMHCRGIRRESQGESLPSRKNLSPVCLRLCAPETHSVLFTHE